MGVGSDKVGRFLDDEEMVAKALSIPRVCTDAEIILHSVATKEIVDRYRDAAEPVKAYWNRLNEYLVNSLAGGEVAHHQGLTFERERIILPNGLSLKYPDLRYVKDEKTGKKGWFYGRKKKLYGGKLCENIVQAVARIVMTDGMLRIQKRYPVVLTVHDEAVMVVREGESEDALAWAIEQMTKEPSYLPGIPLAAEGGHAQRYGNAK
jgi:DNA polymerase